MKEIIHTSREGVCGMEKPMKALSAVIIAALFALILVVTSPTAAWAEDVMSGDCSAAGDGSVAWSLTQNNSDDANPTYTLMISGNGAMADWFEHRATGDNACGTDASISPNSCDNSKCELNRPWAAYLDTITQIEISGNITRLGSESLVSLNKVESIVLPDSLESIGFGSLAGMTSLKKISIPDNVTTIETSAFYGDSALAELNFSDKGNLESIGNYSFSGVGVSGEVNLPEGLKTIGICLFENCDKIEKLVIPASVDEYITTASGYNALFNKNQNSSKASLKEVIIKSSANLPNYMFSNVSSIEKIEITGNVNSIGNFAFNQCTSLSSVSLSSGVKEIGEHAFQYATSLTEINLPSVETIKSWAFANSGLTSINIPSVSKICSSAFYKCLNLAEVKNTSALEAVESGVFQEDSSLSNIDLSSVKTIGSQAFNKTGLVSIDLSSVTEIGSEAFKECSKLTGVSGLQAVQKIGAYAFQSDSVLVDIDLSSAQSIGDQAFRYTGIEQVNLSSITEIRGLVFADCPNLKSVTLVGAPSTGGNIFGTDPSLVTVDLSKISSFDGFDGNALTYWEQSGQLTAFYVPSDISFSASGRPDLRQSGARAIFAITNGGTINGEAAAKGSLVSPVKEGYVFAGWYKDKNYTNEYTNGVVEANPDASNVWTQYHAYAKWTSEITFDANGGTGTMDKQEITEGNSAALTANAFTRSDSDGSYEFVGWNTKADGTGDAYGDGVEITPEGNMTLYAQWAKVDTYSVSAIPNQTYTGLPIEPAVTVKNGNDTIASSQYAVEYSNNTNAGTAIATVTVNPNTLNEKVFILDFSIVKDENPTIEISVPENWTYGDVDKEVTAIAKTSAGNQIADIDVSIKYYSNQACTENETSSLPNAAGTFWAKATLQDTPNHAGKETDAVKVTIAKATPTVDFGITGNAISKTYGDDDFTQSAAVTAPGPSLDPGAFNISYKSNNEDVATVDENGKVHIISAGEATITAEATPSEQHKGDYNSASASYKLTVNPADSSTDPAGTGDGSTQENPLKTAYGKTVAFTVTIKQQPVSDIATQLLDSAGANAGAPGKDQVGFYYNGELLGEFVNYDSANGTATFEYDTTEQLIPAGLVQMIEVKFGGSNNLQPSEGKLFVEIAKASQNLMFANPGISQHVGTVSNSLSGAVGVVTYESSDTSVAIVDSSGLATIVAPGSTVITASAQETDWFKASSVSYTLTVPEHALGTYVYDNTNPEKGHWQECSECDYATNPEAHQFGEWAVTKEATATESGERVQTCMVCGYAATEAIAATGDKGDEGNQADNPSSSNTDANNADKSSGKDKSTMAATSDVMTGIMGVVVVSGVIAFVGAVYAVRRYRKS